MNGALDPSKTNARELAEAERRVFIERARSVAKDIARDSGTVTVDDVRLLCAPPDGIDPRVMGAVFRSDAFEATGLYRPSRRRESHNRAVAVFRLAEAVSR